MVVLSLPGELLKRWASSDDFVRLSAGTSLLFVNHGYYALYGAFQVVPLIKNLPGNARVFKDAGSVRGLGISPGGGRGNPLQYSCLENPMDRGAWWAHDWSDSTHGCSLVSSWNEEVTEKKLLAFSVFCGNQKETAFEVELPRQARPMKGKKL